MSVACCMNLRTLSCELCSETDGEDSAEDGLFKDLHGEYIRSTFACNERISPRVEVLSRFLSNNK